ncbi:MAG: biotin/lipoate--protein ligase family protein [Marivibrio sp.]|uniref:biotin/lipoate--protein ligase family protein n=1 Tax=Marivibrio sp. TaxID=2039719 RepID=UPI0032ECA32B
MTAGDADDRERAETAPALPPLFEARPVGADDDPLAQAVADARAGAADAGALYYPVRPDRLRAALVLAPETPFAHAAEIAYVAMIAFNDALGATLPPQIGVLFGWPDRVLVNGAAAGSMRYVTSTKAADAVPDWMAVGLDLALAGDPRSEPGRELGRTNLFEEGAGEVSPKEILEAFARHFLSWLHRWERDGLKPVAGAWEARMAGVDEPYPFPIYDADGAPTRNAPPARAGGVAQDGAMRVLVDGRERRIALAHAFTAAADLAGGAS